MPLPTPSSGEHQDEFVSRCMEDEIMVEDFPDHEQRLAVCFNQWREARKEAGFAVDERKALTVEIKDAEKGVVEAVFATMEVKDYDDDFTMKGAFGEQEVRVSAYGHSSWTGELPVGKGTIREKGNKAVAELQFFMSTQRGREHFNTIKEMGKLQEWSYGFDVLETGEVTEELRQIGVFRVLKKLKVHEVSPVLLGAGVGTGTLAIKQQKEAEVKDEEQVKSEAEEKAVQEEAARQAEEEVRKREELDTKLREERERLTRNVQKFGRPIWNDMR